MGGGTNSRMGCLRLRGGHRLYSVLRHQLHLHRARGGGGLSLRPVQHRGRRPGLHRRPRHGPGVPASGFPALRPDRARRRRRGCLVRRGLGRRTRVAASLPGQPHRHHHHHVQLHRRLGDGLPARQRHVPARLHGAGEQGFRAACAAPADARCVGRGRSRHRGLASESVVPVGAGLLCRCVAVHLAHAGRLSAEDRGHESAGGPVRRYLAAPSDCRRDAGLRCSRRLHEPERADGGAASAGAGVHRRLRLRRHRGGADGPRASGRHPPRLDSVRRALSGRGGALLRDPQDYARHGGGDPGAGDPVRRGTGIHVRPPPCGRRCCAEPGPDVEALTLLLPDSTLRLSAPPILAARRSVLARRTGA